jgi:hypothetical protein
VLSYIKVVCTIKQQSDKITDPTYGHKPRLRRKKKSMFWVNYPSHEPQKLRSNRSNPKIKQIVCNRSKSKYIETIYHP